MSLNLTESQRIDMLERELERFKRLTDEQHRLYMAEACKNLRLEAQLAEMRQNEQVPNLG
mgnify:CR=1 FL=1